MGYPDQKDDQDTRVPVEDSERPVGEDQVVVGEVIEPDEDRLVDTGTGESVRPAADDETGARRYTGDELDELGAEDDQDDQVVLESSEPGPVTPAPAGETVASSASDAGPDRMGEAIPMPSGAGPDEPQAVRPDAPTGPGDVTNPDPVSPSAAPAGDDHDWREIMAMFVDDPRAATERAASIVDGTVENLVRSLKGEQDSMRSAWQGSGTDTERLRTALKDYRSLWQRLDGFARKA
jgi:hypothetical protein